MRLNTSRPAMRARPRDPIGEPDDPSEEWREISGYEGYEASSLGRIRSLDRYLELVGRWGPMVRFHRGRVLRDRARGPYGYLSIFTTGGRYLQVSRGVAMAFNGEPPSPKHQAAHLDRDQANNRPGNLIWAMPLENADVSRDHGTLPAGSRNGQSRLVEAQIPSIIERYAEGETSHALAVEFGVTANAIAKIATGRLWSHVASPMREAAAQRAKQNIFEALRRGKSTLAG